MTRFFTKAISLSLIFILLLLSACAKMPAGVGSFPLGSEIRSTPLLDTALHSSFKEDLEEIVSSGRFTLSYDKNSLGITVYDSAAEAYWAALPLFSNVSGALLTAAVVSPEGRYYLNSQDNSVFYETYEIKKAKNGITFVFSMSDEAAVAAKTPETLADGDLYLRVPVTFALVDGELRVTVSCEEIFISAGYVLESLSVLPYFGALQDFNAGGAFGDFLLVPDGCGAVMYTDQTDVATENLTLRVYGAGTAVNTAPAVAGCFGVGHGNAALAGVICSGDAIASVRAIRASANTDAVNLVYPEFNITPYSIAEGTYVYGSPYRGPIEIRYQFLQNTGGAYAPLAAACREMLIRSGFLPDGDVPAGEYPMNVSFVFSVNGKTSASAGKLEQAEEVAGLLKAKGVNGMNLVLNGVFADGLYQTDRYSVLRSAGGKKELRALCEYAVAQNISVYAGVNLLTESTAFRAAADLTGKKQKTTVENPLYPYVLAKTKTRYLAAADEIENNIVTLLENTRKQQLSGFAINDSAAFYADHASGANVQDMAQTVSENLRAVSAERQLAVRGGNFRLLRWANLVTELPSSVQFTESEAYQAVPFLQMILHGTLVYSGEPCNRSQLLTLSMLKCVEYGASIAVEWDFIPRSDLFYERTYSETADFYVRANSVLGSLADRRITGHEKVMDGVYVVTYDTGAILYVNYNNYSVNIGSISVPPYDFLIIN